MKKDRKIIFVFGFTIAFVLTLFDIFKAELLSQSDITKNDQLLRIFTATVIIFAFWHIIATVSLIIFRIIVKILSKFIKPKGRCIRNLFLKLKPAISNLYKPFQIITILYILFFLIQGIYIHMQTPNELTFDSSSSYQNDKPPIFLITIDCLSANKLSVYGNTEIYTKTIDEIAKQSIVFTNAFSQSNWTLPSFSSMLSGIYPESVVDNNLLVKTLQNYGYYTQAIITNPYLNPSNGFNTGFTNFFHYTYCYDNPLHFDKRVENTFVFTLLKQTSIPFDEVFRTVYSYYVDQCNLYYRVNAKQLVNHAIEWLSSVPTNTSFFLWLHFIDPHMPYFPPKQYRSEISYGQVNKKFGSDTDDYVSLHTYSDTKIKLLKSLYLQEIKYTDDQLNRLISYLKKKQIFDSSIIIITADHGEAFAEHTNPMTKYPIFMHGVDFYNEEIHVPLIIKMPYQTDAKVIDDIVGLVDLRTFIESAAKLTRNEHKIKPNIKYNKRGYVLSTSNAHWPSKQSIIDKEGNKLIEHTVEKIYRLYNIHSDPQEKNDIINKNQKTVDALKEILNNQQSLRQYQSSDFNNQYDPLTKFGY